LRLPIKKEDCSLQKKELSKVVAGLNLVKIGNSLVVVFTIQIQKYCRNCKSEEEGRIIGVEEATRPQTPQTHPSTRSLSDFLLNMSFYIG